MKPYIDTTFCNARKEQLRLINLIITPSNFFMSIFEIPCGKITRATRTHGAQVRNRHGW